MFDKLSIDRFAQQLNKMKGEELKALRLKANLTQKELAEKIGVSDSRVSEWEHGKYKISNAYVRILNGVLK